MNALSPANLMELEVPYPVLLAEYQQRVAALTNENLMLRAMVAHMRQAAPRPVPMADAGSPSGDG